MALHVSRHAGLPARLWEAAALRKTLVALGCALVVAGPAAGDPQASPLTPPADLDLRQSPRVPLTAGLTVVIAVVEERGDYEVVQRVSSAGGDRIQVSYSTTVPVDGQPTELHGQRIVFTSDLRSARIYRVRWLSGRVETARGTTALGVSTAVLNELRTVGRSECSLASIEEADTLIAATGLPSPELEGTLERVGHGPVPVPVMVDGRRQWLPALHAKGTFEGLTGEVDAEFWFLDDPDNPLTLRAAIGSARLAAVRIDRPKDLAGPLVEQALAADEKVELPGIYFEFASARLRPESASALDELAGILRRHGDWRVRLEGHTDDIGGADTNLALSRARAAAVRQAVIERLGGGAERLESAGFGAASPRESNETPEGRARNRRVEAVRMR